MSVNHYENFPVGSLILPRRLRKPIHAIYAYARTADDIADEGDADDAARLQGLAELRAGLDAIAGGGELADPMMQRLQQQAIAPFQMPMQPFYDLLSAFEQDVVKKRYQTFGELVDYSRRSANPVGRMLLHLYGEHDSRSLAQSDGICTALQLINFWQDISVDVPRGRYYLPVALLAKYGISQAEVQSLQDSPALRQVLAECCTLARQLMLRARALPGRIGGQAGLELRLVMAGGIRILDKIAAQGYNTAQQRPALSKKDALPMLRLALCLPRPR